MSTAKKTTESLPPLVEINKDAVIEKVVTVNKKDPLLVDLKITNPIVYIKAWWKRVMSSEGVDFRFKIHPLTAFGIAAILATLGFGVGRLVLPADNVIVKYVPQLGPVASPDPWRETAFSGIVRFSTVTKKYYLETSQSEAITLNTPDNVDLSKLVGKRIFATGRLNKDTGVLIVYDASDLEILPIKIVPVPVTSPNPEITP